MWKIGRFGPFHSGTASGMLSFPTCPLQHSRIVSHPTTIIDVSPSGMGPMDMAALTA